MTRARDLFTLDMFDIPVPAPQTPGSMNYSCEIAHVMSDALKACPYDRYEVAARMSRLLGSEVSVNMLNAYTAESRETHNITLERAIAFDAATEGYALLKFMADKRGCRVLVGKEALLAELGEIGRIKQELAEQEKAIKAAIGRGFK